MKMSYVEVPVPARTLLARYQAQKQAASVIRLVSFVWKAGVKYAPPGIRYTIYGVDGEMDSHNVPARTARWRALSLAREATVKLGRRVHVKMEDFDGR